MTDQPAEAQVQMLVPDGMTGGVYSNVMAVWNSGPHDFILDFGVFDQPQQGHVRPDHPATTRHRLDLGGTMSDTATVLPGTPVVKDGAYSFPLRIDAEQARQFLAEACERAGQAWYWTATWQAMERDADEEIESGDTATFQSGEEFLRDLDG